MLKGKGRRRSFCEPSFWDPLFAVTFFAPLLRSSSIQTGLSNDKIRHHVLNFSRDYPIGELVSTPVVMAFEGATALF